MKTDIWPDDTSMVQMSDWLAGLREGDDAGSGPTDRPVGPEAARASRPEPSATAAPNGPISRIEIFAAEARARAQARAEIHASARAGTMTRADVRGRAQITARAVIGDELRMPIMRCEMGSCISWHSDPDALGEADIRARAIAAGWRVDALGRLACPRCQQSDGQFWATHPVRLRAPDAAPGPLLTAPEREDAAGVGGGTEARALPAVEPALVPLPVQEWRPDPVSHHAMLAD